MSESILDSMKNALGIVVSEEPSPFDYEILMHLNTAIAGLSELGVGPEKGLEVITANAIWDDVLPKDDARLIHAKSYVYLRVRLLFDPPQTAHAIMSMEKQIEKLEWHLTVTADEIRHPRVEVPGGSVDLD